MTDEELLDWLQDQVVDTIYLDDGRIIDVRGGNVRGEIYNATLKPTAPTGGPTA